MHFQSGLGFDSRVGSLGSGRVRSLLIIPGLSLTHELGSRALPCSVIVDHKQIFRRSGFYHLNHELGFNHDRVRSL